MVLRTKSFEFQKRVTTQGNPEGGTFQPIVQLYTPSSDDNGISVSYSALLESLRVVSFIEHFDEPQIPEQLDSLNTAESYAASKDYLWNSPRYELAIMYQINGLWSERFRIPLLAKKPYQVQDVLTYFTRQPSKRIAQGSVLAFQLRDAGYGFPREVDRIDIVGEGLEEADLVQQATDEGQYLILRDQIDSLTAANVEMVGKLNTLLTTGITVIGETGGGSPSPTPSDPFANADPNAGSVLVDGNTVLVDGNSVLVDLQ